MIDSTSGYPREFASEQFTLELPALKLLQEYARLAPSDPERFVPVHIEHLVEQFLRLRIEFDELNSTDDGDIYAALNIDDGEITIDESLDPVMHPENQAIYSMTLAHEVAHFVLHADRGCSGPQRMCRAIPSNVTKPLDIKEEEAEIFALHLLTPRDWIVHGLRTCFERVAPIVVTEQKPFLLNCRPDIAPMSRCITNWDAYLSGHTARADWFIAWHLGRLFRVAPEVIYRKLVCMGLIRWHRTWVWNGLWVLDAPPDGFLRPSEFLWSDWFVPEDERDHFWLRDSKIQRAHWTSRAAFAEGGRALFIITCTDNTLVWRGKKSPSF